MAYLKNLNTFNSEMGDLSVFENLIPGEIKRIFYISNVPKDAVRGKHRHHKTWQALICINGSCRVYVDDSVEENMYQLDSNSKCLIVEPKDWHFMDQFEENTILLVIANQYYDIQDYIDQPYSNKYLSRLEQLIVH
jgi:dTDP-4-dehydrorhamnose 3,5-epimerase-like enzyme